MTRCSVLPLILSGYNHPGIQEVCHDPYTMVSVVVIIKYLLHTIKKRNTLKQK